jgi:primosomal protein N' (replication factor Y)
MTTARVLPNVTGLDKAFDYVVSDIEVQVGDVVRIELHGRRVGGWVIAVDPPDVHDIVLKPITKWSSCGPGRDVVELSEWAAVRWAGRRRHFLGAASPPRNVARIPASRRTGTVVEPRSPASSQILSDGGGVLRLSPTSDPMPAVLSATAVGPTLVVVPGLDDARLLAARLRRSGLAVALAPDDWSSAAGGVDVVIGARAAAWAPCPDLAAAVVIDEHDEALQEEGSPTWHARDVVIERARRADVPVLLVSPCPTLTAIEWRTVTRPPRDREKAGWPIVDVIDRSEEDPWKRSLVTSRLIEHLRDADRRVVCVSNTTGRAALLACRECRELTRCERCDAAVVQADDGRLVCLRCDAVRPPVCRNCGAGRFANLRPGVSRLREELEAAASRPVALVTGRGYDGPDDAPIVVGTEAALHRVSHADTVAFLDFDRELLSPRYRAGEQAMALLARAARLVGPRARGGRILIQTFSPRHDVIQAALLADPGRLADSERERRRMLQLPPYGAYAEISGSGSDEFVASLPAAEGVMVVGGDEAYVARADDWMALGAVLSEGERPTGSRLRVAVDPPR